VLPSLTPSLQEFAKIPLWDFQASWDFIKMHRDVVVPGAADALLVAAFRAQSDGRPDEAKKCVHQSKLLNYCDSLGKDGVRVFFQR
jgi:cell division cycle protein 37